MALKTFETRNAEYYLVLGQHDDDRGTSVLIDKLKDLDMLVLETWEYEPKRFAKEGRNHQQYKSMFDRINECRYDFPIFSVDYHTTEFITPKYFSDLISNKLPRGAIALSGIYFLFKTATHLIANGMGMDTVNNFWTLSPLDTGLLGLGGISSLYLGFEDFYSRIVSKSDSEVPILPEVQGIITSLVPTPLVGFRDAAAARKIEEYLLPEYFRNRRPKVGIIYGDHHAGIKPKLQHKSLRDITLELYRRIGYFGTTKDNINRVTRFYMSRNSELKVAEIADCGLF